MRRDGKSAFAVNMGGGCPIVEIVDVGDVVSEEKSASCGVSTKMAR